MECRVYGFLESLIGFVFALWKRDLSEVVFLVILSYALGAKAGRVVFVWSSAVSLVGTSVFSHAV